MICRATSRSPICGNASCGHLSVFVKKFVLCLKCLHVCQVHSKNLRRFILYFSIFFPDAELMFWVIICVPCISAWPKLISTLRALSTVYTCSGQCCGCRSAVVSQLERLKLGTADSDDSSWSISHIFLCTQYNTAFKLIVQDNPIITY